MFIEFIGRYPSPEQALMPAAALLPWHKMLLALSSHATAVSINL